MLGERLSRALHRWDSETVKGDAPDGERQSATTITRARWTLAPSESEIQDRANPLQGFINKLLFGGLWNIPLH